MEQHKLNIFPRLLRSLLCTAVASLLVLCLILSVGVAYGRYSTTIAEDVGFTVQSEPKIYCMAPRDESGIGAAIPTQWSPMENTTFNQTVSLCVSNSDQSGDYRSAEDMIVRIRLYLPDGASTESGEIDPFGSLKITLQIEGEDTEYITDGGKSLSTRSALAMQKNAGGWIYTFVESDGTELIRTLKGGQVSDLNITLTATDASARITDFELLIDRLYTTDKNVDTYHAEEAVS